MLSWGLTSRWFLPPPLIVSHLSVQYARTPGAFHLLSLCVCVCVHWDPSLIIFGLFIMTAKTASERASEKREKI